MKLKTVIERLDARWPAARAEAWDPVGLQIGDPEAEIGSVGIALDWNRRALGHFAERCELVLTHHPLFFHPLKGLRADVPAEALVRETLAAGLAVWSAHTNLDSSPDQTSVSRCLVRALGWSDTDGVPLVPGDPGVNPEGGLGWVVTPGGTKGELLRAVRALPGTTGVLLNRVAADAAPVGITAVWGGSWDPEALPRLRALGVRTLVAGEIRYHDQDTLALFGIDTVMMGHDVSEQPALEPWAEAVRECLREEIWVEVLEGPKTSG